MKLGLFTDTLEDINGVARFIRDMGEQARAAGRDLTINTCVKVPQIEDPPFARRNFAPLVSSALPYYPQLSVALPPPWAMLHWAEQQKFDVIHCSTPGPVGVCGWLIAKWLKIPFGATYHTDFPAYVERLSGSRFMAGGTAVFMKLFYRGASLVFSRSREYEQILVDLGVRPANLRTLRPAINLHKFNRSFHDPGVWDELGVREPKRLLYVGRVSVEKNLPMLVKAYRRLCERRRDAALIVVGDGPYLEPMRRELAGVPAYLPGVKGDRDLARMYSSADVFVFPSRTDTLGQVVMESQACGLPALVSDEGGPKTIVRHDVTGRVIEGNTPEIWSAAMERLMDDSTARQRMSSAAMAHLRQFDLTDTFDHFWSEHEAVLQRARARDGRPAAAPVVRTYVGTATDDPAAGAAAAATGSA